MRCVLIENPAAGRKREKRSSVLAQIVEALESHGHTVEVLHTAGPGQAAILARNAISSADAIFACGGDGTVHEVLQGMVHEGQTPAVALGVIPLGSANALARHLRLPLDPVAAALLQARSTAKVLPVGKVLSAGTVRYFLLMAGVGPDGELAFRLQSSQKARLGHLAYPLQALRTFLGQRLVPFQVEITPAANEPALRRTAIGAMVVRVRSMGGIFSGLTDSRADLSDEALQLYCLAPPAWLSYPLWFVLGWLRLAPLNPFLQRAQVVSVAFRSLGSPAPRTQIDAEPLGQLPFEVTLLPHAVRIFVP